MNRNSENNWNIRDACEVTTIFGAAGSGKSSASQAALLQHYLDAGMGGIFLCAKPDATAGEDVSHEPEL